MNTQHDDFENYLRRFRLRPVETQFLLVRPARNFRRWWVGGVAAGIIVASVAVMVTTRAGRPAIPKAEPSAASIPAAPSTPAPVVSVPPTPPPSKPRPVPEIPRPKAPEPPTIVTLPPPLEAQAPQTEQPQTEGQKIFERVCSACHDLGAAAGLRFSTRAEYESYISMKRPKGVRISDEELPILADYLFQRFGKR